MNKLAKLFCLCLLAVSSVWAQTKEETIELLNYVGSAEKATAQDVERLTELRKTLLEKKYKPEEIVQKRDELTAVLKEILQIYYKMQGANPMPNEQILTNAARGLSLASLIQFADCETIPSGQKLTPPGQFGKVEKLGNGKTPLILLPDAFTDGDFYKTFIERNKNLYTMYAVTFPGDGETPPPARPDKFDPSGTPWLDNLELALANLIDKEKLKKPAVVGTQIGAYIAARIALKNPEKVGRVILLNGLVYSQPSRSRANPEKLATLEERRQAVRNRNFTSLMIVPEMFPKVRLTRQCAETFVEKLAPVYQSLMLSTVRDLGRAKQIFVEGSVKSDIRSYRYNIEIANTDLTEELKNLTVPMLSIPAVRDYESPPNVFAYPQWSDIKARYPEIPLTVAPFQNTRGYISEDAPKELDQAVADFLAGKTEIRGKPFKRSERASPRASATQEFGDNNIAVVYGRPQVKNRKVWGELVPLGRVWRSGADEATTITINKDVLIEGQKLAAGKYTFFAIPNESEWTLIFNKSQYQWGAFYYTSDLDALRIKVKPQPAEHEESVRYYFNYLSPTSAEMVLHWEKIKVAAKIEDVKK
jgi:pimeloyl-ACP methyl ester carboxylesterase